MNFIFYASCSLVACLFFSKLSFAFDDNQIIQDSVIGNLPPAVHKSKKAPASVQNILSRDYHPGAGFSLVRDPEVLAELEKRGFSFAHVLGLNSYPFSNRELESRNQLYKSFVQSVRKDTEELLAFENSAGKRPPAGVGMSFARRIFDWTWLVSQHATFELVGVLNRIDRVHFEERGCGETRLIYRLSYQANRVYSRMPLTLLVKYENRGSSPIDWALCKAIADRWIYPSQEKIKTNEDLASWMISPQGPLSSQIVQLTDFSTIELNFQALRIPSSARPDLAGHGTYLMRVYKKVLNRLEETYLENTPDVEKINSSRTLKREFLAQFSQEDFIRKLGEGILMLDEKYLAKKAFSYSPYGISRRENRLFDQIITERDLRRIQFQSTSYVKSARAAIMRLNDYSCTGCHQARAHAGFHYLGIDKKSTHPFNSLSFEGSGHFQLEMKRRDHYLEKLRHGETPDHRRDFSFAPPAGESSGHGQFCGLPQSSFSHWQCEPNLKCQQIDQAENDTQLGKCFAEKAMAGDPVLIGSITQDSYHKDKIVVRRTKTCGEGSSQFATFLTRGGFPSGQCYRKNCEGIDPQSETELCSEAAGNGFNSCLAKTGQGTETFESCLEKTLIHYGFGRCNEDRPCRNDFVCAKSFNGQGYCTPSYFLFQIRLDGHVDPRTGR